MSLLNRFVLFQSHFGLYISIHYVTPILGFHPKFLSIMFLCLMKSMFVPFGQVLCHQDEKPGFGLALRFKGSLHRGRPDLHCIPLQYLHYILVQYIQLHYYIPVNCIPSQYLRYILARYHIFTAFSRKRNKHQPSITSFTCSPTSSFLRVSLACSLAERENVRQHGSGAES